MNYKYKTKKKLSKKSKAKILLVFICVLIFAFIWYLTAVVNPVVVEASEAKVKSLTQNTMSNSVLSIISNSDIYDELISYSFDNNNKINMINVNSYKANILARQISSLAQSTLDNTTSAGIEIHLGAFTGLAALATSGPLIKFNFTPIGTIVVQFRSEFTSAGINQTLHKIYINIQSSVYVVLPTANPKIETSTEVLITECIIVGEIPSTFLQSSYLDEMLNLVPVNI